MSSTVSYKIAVIGSPDAILGFKAVGVDVFAATTPEQAEAHIRTLYNGEEYAAVFITEDLAERIADVLDSLPPKALPAIVAVPSHTGSTGAGLLRLKKIVEQAVGSDILAER